MNIFLDLTLVIAIIIVMLRFKFPIGACMIVGGLFIWLTRSAEVAKLGIAFVETFLLARTYDIIFALYFVMCLEIELRVSGILTDMVHSLRRTFSGVKTLLAIMPAFLGLLPSVGGARFSAPIVEELSADLNLTAEDKSAINFWFRHIFEFSNPIIPGMIMACSIAGVDFGEFLKSLSWVTIVAFSVGWFVLIRPIKNPPEPEDSADKNSHEKQSLFLAFGSMASIFLIIVMFNLNASTATFIVIAALFVILHLVKRPVGFKETFVGAIDLKMTLNICGILYFIQLLEVTDILSEIVSAFHALPLPIPVVIACISFIVGILTGLSQGHVAIIMPIVAAMGAGAGHLDLACVAMVFGAAGQMLTPTHVCLIITVDYFKANLLKTIEKLVICEILVTTIFSVIAYITWK